MEGRGMKTWVLVIDVEKCENCQNCFLACKDEHVGNDWPGYAAPQPSLGPRWIQVLNRERGQYPFVDVAYLPVPCQHCEQAPCLKASRDGAVTRRPDGIVLIDPVKARGQKELIQACPYGAISWNEERGIPQKCTLCAHLLDEGWGRTRCVQACPTEALRLHNLEEQELKRLIEVDQWETYQPQWHTNPRVYYKNIHRFTRCFLGGSVAFQEAGKEECAVGAQVSLANSSGQAIAETVTDAFGDFKFDRLPESSGRYSIRLSFANFPDRVIEVDLQTSLYLGAILLESGKA
jgi:Fe-S-cluster-containing dehydrogenase component